MSAEFQTMHPRAEQLLVNQLREHGLLEIAELGVRVRQGIAYIEGAVPNLRQKKLVGEIASHVEGIRDVVNMLRITPLPVVDDESLKKHIRRLLTRNPKIDEDNISVEVMDGVVYLGGFVGTAVEKRLAELEVWAASGVRDISNRIEVLSAEPKSEIQIAGEILQSFSICLGLDLSKITVDFREGVAHLRGTVPTDYLKQAAEELATWTPSVTSVINELKVLELPGFRGYSLPRLKKSPAEDCPQSMSGSAYESRQGNVIPAGQQQQGVA
ncbi:MAG: BON domain-containing protein [Dehalococcoidales bacterium]